MRLTKKRVLHWIVLPSFLIGSDLFIGFMGHFSGATDNAFTWGAFSDYITKLTFEDIAPILFIVFCVVIIVELIIRHGE